MLPLYGEDQDSLQIEERKSTHFPPHLHKSVEIVYVTEGTLEFGVGIELYHMGEGDLGIAFPNQIHHFQVFGKGVCRSISLLASPSFFGQFSDLLNAEEPENPIIRHADLPPEAEQTLRNLLERKRGEKNPGTAGPAGEKTAESVRSEKLLAGLCRDAADHASVQLILALTIPALTLRGRKDASDFDLVYQVVDYIARHFRENLSLAGMAASLGVSRYVLSRVFSGTFHMNFNRYLNRVRLDYACALLAGTDDPVTDICYGTGFQSQATFNRSFQETYHMTPRAFRALKRGPESTEKSRL